MGEIKRKVIRNDRSQLSYCDDMIAKMESVLDKQVAFCPKSKIQNINITFPVQKNNHLYWTGNRRISTLQKELVRRRINRWDDPFITALLQLLFN